MQSLQCTLILAKFVGGACCQHSLLMNLDKIKFLMIGVTKLLKQLPDYPIKLISPTLVALYLAVFLNQWLPNDEHILTRI